MITATRHTGLVVRDLEKSVAFYQRLGLTVFKRAVEEGKFIETVVDIPDVRLEWAKLKAPDGSLLELLQYHSHPQDRPVTRAPSNQLGCSHVAFTVLDVAAACREVESAGGSLVNAPALSPDGAARVAYVHDPDGILIELVQVVA